MPISVRRGGKKNRKHGRMKRKPAYIRYCNSDRRNKNKARKLKRYMRKFPNWKPNNVSEDVLKYIG